MSSLAFHDIEHLPVLRRFHEIIHDFLGVGVGFFDLEGNESRVLTPLHKPNRLCLIVRRTERGRQACRLCDSKACRRCVATRRSYIYECHLGLTEVTVPLLLHGKPIGVFSSGQFLLKPPSRSGFVAMAPKLKSLGADLVQARRHYFRTPVISRTVAESMVALISLVGDYIAEAEHKILEIRQIAQADHVRRVKEIVESRYAENISLRKVAGIMGLSESRLAHLLKEQTGTTFTEYRNRLRIERGRFLLANSRARVIDVALDVGFANLSHFHSTFKRVVGCSPLEYRRQRSAEVPRRIPGA